MHHAFDYATGSPTRKSQKTLKMFNVETGLLTKTCPLADICPFIGI